MKRLYFGDNLDILKDLYRQYPQGFIDLIYIDPPFNSKRNYNILFENINMEDTKAQKEAFADTWSNVTYMDELEEIHDLDLNIYRFLKAIEEINVSKGAVSYLTTMAIRIWYMYKLLTETGSFYLHCDPNMSHYLKLICDLVFGEKCFRNEIIWKRTSAHSDAKGYGNAHDVILYYTITDKNKWIQTYQPYDKEYTDTYYRYKDPNGRRWMSDNLSAKGLSGGGYSYAWKGVDGLWRCPESKMKELDDQGKIYYTKNNVPRLKRYLDEAKGLPTQDIWDDIEPLRSWHNEKIGYPTQKPTALLDRMINSNTEDGDIVADFFCGCGTTIAAAEKLNRKWLGVDISHLAVKLITKRLIDNYGHKIRETFEIFGFPRDLDSARELATGANGGRLKFEEWIIEVMLHGVLNPKRTETGYDGYMTFDAQGTRSTVLIEVKSGNASLTQLNHFIKTIENKNAQMGLFVCFEDQATSGMRKAAKQQGYFNQDQFGSQYDKIQIITVEDLLDHRQPNIPASIKGTFKTAKKETKEQDTQQKMF